MTHTETVRRRKRSDGVTEKRERERCMETKRGEREKKKERKDNKRTSKLYQMENFEEDRRNERCVSSDENLARVDQGHVFLNEISAMETSVKNSMHSCRRLVIDKENRMGLATGHRYLISQREENHRRLFGSAENDSQLSRNVPREYKQPFDSGQDKPFSMVRILLQLQATCVRRGEKTRLAAFHVPPSVLIDEHVRFAKCISILLGLSSLSRDIERTCDFLEVMTHAKRVSSRRYLTLVSPRSDTVRSDI